MPLRNRILALGSCMMNTMCLQCNVVNIDPCMGHHETVRLDKTGKQGRRNGKKNGEDKVITPNWHTFTLFLYFLDWILLAEFFIKNFQTFLELKIDINWVSLTH